MASTQKGLARSATRATRLAGSSHGWRGRCRTALRADDAHYRGTFYNVRANSAPFLLGSPLLASQRALAQAIRQLTTRIKGRAAEEWTQGLVAGHVEQMERYWRDYVNNHVALVNSPGETEAEHARSDEYAEVEMAYLAAKGTLYDARPGPSNGADSEGTTDSTRYGIRKQGRLPKIEVPPFSGLQEDWESFRDLFSALIDLDATLSDVEKIFYLKTLVKGEAKAAIDSLETSGQNYQTAWAILEARYDDRRLLVRGHLTSLLRLRPMREESSTEIRRLTDELERHRSQLASLGRPVHHWDDWLVTVADQCMDSTTRRDWEEEVGAKVTEREYPTYSLLKAFLQQRCTLLRTLATEKPRSRPSEYSRPSGGGSAPGQRPLGAHATTTEVRRGCAECNGPHVLGYCDAFHGKSARERWSTVIRTNVCRNCLREGHAASECPSSFSCRSCGGRHHTLLHDGAPPRRSIGDGRPDDAKRRRLQVAATATNSRGDEIDANGGAAHQD